MPSTLVSCCLLTPLRPWACNVLHVLLHHFCFALAARRCAECHVVLACCAPAAAVAVNGVILVAKAVTWWLTGSG